MFNYLFQPELLDSSSSQNVTGNEPSLVGASGAASGHLVASKCQPLLELLARANRSSASIRSFAEFQSLLSAASPQWMPLTHQSWSSAALQTGVAAAAGQQQTRRQEQPERGEPHGEPGSARPSIHSMLIGSSSSSSSDSVSVVGDGVSGVGSGFASLRSSHHQLPREQIGQQTMHDCFNQLQLRDYYSQYDILVGLRTASTLTILFIVFILFVIYKTGCRDNNNTNNQPSPGPSSWSASPARLSNSYGNARNAHEHSCRAGPGSPRATPTSSHQKREPESHSTRSNR